MKEEALIEISGVRKEYKDPGKPNTVALNGVDLAIRENEFICVVGPSGCGKTTLLNIIAGLETFDSGFVKMHGEDIIGPGPERGVIFQQYALFPWMTVRKNIEYGLKFQKKRGADGSMVPYTKEEKRELADYWLTQESAPEPADRHLQWLFFFFTEIVMLGFGFHTWWQISVTKATRARIREIRETNRAKAAAAIQKA